MPTMTAEGVLELWQLLTAAEVDCWVDGGWGVDALVRQQTREHGDLDLGVARPDLAKCIELLGSVGYAVTDARFEEVTVQLTDADGQRVDLHPSTPVADGGSEQIDFDGNTFYIPPPVVGEIGGQVVRCMPVSAQLHTHKGYELRPPDVHDLELLRKLAGETAPGQR